MVKNSWGVPILMVCGVSAVEFLCGIDSSFSSHQQFEYKVFVPLPWEPSASESFETRDFPKLTSEFLDGTSPRVYPWNQSKIENLKSSSPRIYPWGQSKISNLKSQIDWLSCCDVLANSRLREVENLGGPRYGSQAVNLDRAAIPFKVNHK